MDLLGVFREPRNPAPDLQQLVNNFNAILYGTMSLSRS